MFFKPGEHKAHGLPFNPLKGLVLPRPIGWITTVSSTGIVNLAPFSYFNAVSDTPPMIIFSVNASPKGGAKDSLDNVIATREFVVNLATWNQRDAVKITSEQVGPEVNEMELAGLKALPSKEVLPPRVAGSPAHLECRLHSTVSLPQGSDGRANTMVIGEVVFIHIEDEFIVDGIVDVLKMRPIARLGYKQYAVVDSVFEL